MLSLSRIQVNAGNIIYDAPNADKRIDQSSLISPYPIFVAHQKQIKAGTPKHPTANTILFSQNLQTSCELFANQVNV